MKNVKAKIEKGKVSKFHWDMHVWQTVAGDRRKSSEIDSLHWTTRDIEIQATFWNPNQNPQTNQLTKTLTLEESSRFWTLVVLLRISRRISDLWNNFSVKMVNFLTRSSLKSLSFPTWIFNSVIGFR